MTDVREPGDFPALSAISALTKGIAIMLAFVGYSTIVFTLFEMKGVGFSLGAALVLTFVLLMIWASAEIIELMIGIHHSSGTQMTLVSELVILRQDQDRARIKSEKDKTAEPQTSSS
ncbi:MAG: hypothetical protein V7707_18880 [Motiliproteus sp.]